MKAVILAAGRNEEIAPFIGDFPKCMLGLDGETVIGRQIRILKNCGIRESDIVVVVGYKKEKIAVNDNVVLLENPEYAKTGNAYSLFLALNRIVGEEDVVVLDGDLIFEEELIRRLVSMNGNVLVGEREATAFEKTGIDFDEELNLVNSIGKHISGTITYSNIMRLQVGTARALQKILSRDEYKKVWYTVPLDKIFEKERFQLFLSNEKVCEINNYNDYRAILEKYGTDRELILVTGASGFLGEKLYHILKRQHTVIGIKNNANSDKKFMAIDLSDFEKTLSFINIHKPSVIINTAGIADPDICMNNRELAERVNVTAVDNLVKICRMNAIKLIHISTDYVFAGNQKSAYEKTAPWSPVNFYGETKARAEKLVKQCIDSLIVRTPILYGYNDENDKPTFPTKVLKSLQKGETVEADNIQKRYPVLIDELATAIEEKLDMTGILHVTSQKAVTKFEWAKIIAKSFGFENAKIVEKNGTQEQRPLNVHLATDADDVVTSDVVSGTDILRNQLGCVFKLIYKSSPHKKIYGRNVGQYRYWLGEKLGESIPSSVVGQLDCIIPVPSSGLFYAMGLSKKIGVPYVQALLKPDSGVRSFQLSDLSMRESVIRDKIFTISGFIKDKTVALVDEAVFTGTTLRVVCDMVRACRVKAIYICIPTPVCTKRCHEHVMPDRKMLGENGESMAEYFNVQGIFFQPEKTFLESIKDIRNNCHKCFSDGGNINYTRGGGILP